MVKELIQGEATTARISAEIEKILGNVLYANEIKQKLSAVRSQLKRGGASAGVAQLAISLMETA